MSKKQLYMVFQLSWHWGSHEPNVIYYNLVLETAAKKLFALKQDNNCVSKMDNNWEFNFTVVVSSVSHLMPDRSSQW